MRLAAFSFRSKMLLPALVASGAMLLATIAGAWLLSGSVQELGRLESSHFPRLQLGRELEVRLAALERQLEDAAATADGSGVAAADQLESELRHLLETTPASALPAARRDALVDSVEGWYHDARKVTLKVVKRDPGDGIQDAVKSSAARYKMLKADVGELVAQAQRDVNDGFARARGLQTRVYTWGLGAAFVAAIAGLGLAVFLARTASRSLERLAGAALELAEGDLGRKLEIEGDDEVAALAGSFQRMVERLRAIVSTLKDAAQELSASAADLVEHTEGQTANVQRQATGITETSTTTRELEQTSVMAASRAAAVLEVARRAGQMSETGREAADRSLDGLKDIQGSVDALVTRSAHLLEQARQVGDIVETVRDLAMQSHVLSLNASIEAARAGEAGKGFGVVASEVRALAEQSGQAASNIARIVKEILGAIQATLESTESGTRGMEGSIAQIRASGESLREIGGIVGETSEAALQIAGAVQQQSQGVAQIAAAMRDLDRGMEDTVGRIDRLRDAASRLSETATRISIIADGFRL
ncbi:MAG: methyl-accepting chemotaxis protein [Anaeromyxobacter sp.]